MNDLERERKLRAIAIMLSVELQECRTEGAAASSDEMRSWFDGRRQGVERALTLLDGVMGPIDYQRRA